MVKRLFYYMILLVAVLLTACTSDDTTDNKEPLPEGMGRIVITICAPETAGGDTQSPSTRAVYEEDAENRVHDFPWEAPDHEWEKLKTFRVYICSLTDGGYVVKEVISGDESMMSEPIPEMSEHPYRTVTLTSEPKPAGSYYIFATANFNSSENEDDAYDDGFGENSVINENALKKFANSSYYYVVGNDAQYTGMKNIPMTGKLTSYGLMHEVVVYKGSDTNAGTLMLWRVMGKMQFEFTNDSDRDIRILGIEVDPINKVSTNNPGIYLFSKDDLTSTADLAPGATPPAGKEGLTLPNGVRDDMGPVVFTPALVESTAQPLTLAAKNDGNTDQGKLYFYVNESDGTYTTTNNQYSLRFKVQRKKDDNNWYEEEIRYGVTTHHDLSDDGTYGGTNGGFNVIRRNDWIHIPVVLTDWQMRIEPLAFVPIAGYPAKTLSSNGLTATFSTGGMIALLPFVKKYDDKTWRNFGDPEITYGNEVKDGGVVNDEDSWEASILWKNADGDTQSGDDLIVKTPFAYDPVTKCIIGELNNDLDADDYDVDGLSVFTKDGHKCFKTTFTVCLKLGPKNDPTKQYVYTFTFNIILNR